MSRPLTSIDPNTVALQPALLPAPLPTVHHHHSLRNPSGNGSAENLVPGNAPTATEKVTPASNANNKKKRKSDGTETSNAQADKHRETAPAKRPKTSRSRESDVVAPVKAPSRKALAEALLDASSVYLPGEDAGCVPVYETCDTIRRKVRAVLREDGLTQAGYCRALAQAAPTLGKPPQTSQLARFLGHKGPLGGNTSSVFYASYVLFEKLRIRDRRPKSKFRLEMEEIHGDGGVDIEHNMNTQAFTLHVTEEVVVDKYGHVQFVKKT